MIEIKKLKRILCPRFKLDLKFVQVLRGERAQATASRVSRGAFHLLLIALAAITTTSKHTPKRDPTKAHFASIDLRWPQHFAAGVQPTLEPNTLGAQAGPLDMKLDATK